MIAGWRIGPESIYGAYRLPKLNSIDFDSLVIGAGVVGLACARTLAQSGRSVLVVEAEARFGEHASSRNSEVIHAGIYYPAGSLKAELCVRGKTLLYEYCVARGIAHQRLGKIIVATNLEEAQQLQAIQERARAAGVALDNLSAARVAQLEPEVLCCEALWSASSGIVDSHGLMLALVGDCEQAGGLVVLRTRFEAATPHSDAWRVVLANTKTQDAAGAQTTTLLVREIVNCAGLKAPSVAAKIAGLDRCGLPVERYLRGHYFMLNGRRPFRHLVYPVPAKHGLGVHVTLDLAGQVRFGPDVASWPETIDYNFEDGRREIFIDAIRRYYPSLSADDLHPGYTGLRAKITGPDEPGADFCIAGPAQHGLAGVVNLMGIESPGLTSSLAIAEHVLQQFDGV